MSAYRNFAIWGAGNLGGRIATRLLERNASVIILSRPSSISQDKNQELARKGAEIRPFDVSSADASTDLKGIDVLISTSGFEGLSLQTTLAKAALAAGVKLFVPTEFGDITDGRTEFLMTFKASIREEIKGLGLPTVAFFSGLWTEWVENLGFDLKNGKIEIKGQGDAEISTTSIDDVARFVAYVLTELPNEKLENAKFSIQGDKITFNSLAVQLQELSGKKFDITHVPRSVFEENITKNPQDAFSGLFLGWDLGKGKHPNTLSNDVYPDWHPKSAIEVLKPLLQ